MIAETREALTLLRAKGFGELLDALADPKLYKGVGDRRAGGPRPYMRKIARRLKLKRKDLEAMFRRARETLAA